MIRLAGGCFGRLREFKGKGRASGLEELGWEVLDRVLELVATDMRALLALGRTNHHLHALSLPYIYRRIRICLSPSPARMRSSNELIRSLLADDIRRPYVREVEVYGGGGLVGDGAGGGRRLEGAEWGTVRFLWGLLLRLKHLDKFEWLTPLLPPSNMTAFLASHFPTCLLSIGHWDGLHPRSFPLRPARLYSLTVVLSYDALGSSEETWKDRLGAVQCVLREGKDLRHLTLKLVGPQGSRGKGKCALDLSEVKRFPPLCSLKLEGYRFSASHAAHWRSALDGPKLESLSLRGCKGVPHFLGALTGRLRRLSSLTLADNYCPSGERGMAPIVLASFLMGLSLEELSIPGEYRAVLAHVHGETLRDLTIHTRERGDGKPRDTLSVDELERVADWCPSLRSLSVDLDRRQGWPGNFIAALALLRLERLSVFCELGLGCPPVLQKPEVGCEEARLLWAMVSRYRVLPVLEVWVGEWERPLGVGEETGGGKGEGKRWAGWETYNRRWWRAEARGGEVEVREMGEWKGRDRVQKEGKVTEKRVAWYLGGGERKILQELNKLG